MHVATFDEEYDLIIVGAGPAGLFCAINAYEKGRKILVLEKKRSPGRKLLVSGSGHCNITHDGDMQAFLDHYGDHGRFIRPAILGFTNRDLISFFEARELAMTRVESGKVFPETMRSEDVLAVLIRECGSGNVQLRCGQRVSSLTRNEDGFGVTAEGCTFRSDLLVIATGGRSYPATGSTGDGYRFARSLGHGVTDVVPALTPVRIKDHPFSGLAGITFSDMEVSLVRKKKISVVQGDVLFTHQGLSGPGILDLSRHIR
ncbi:MAG: aminoacetone oxidase family FAD-binding enzyme, partial [Methanothrix sp.]